jgi:hypothetical protein
MEEQSIALAEYIQSLARELEAICRAGGKDWRFLAYFLGMVQLEADELRTRISTTDDKAPSKNRR